MALSFKIALPSQLLCYFIISIKRVWLGYILAY